MDILIISKILAIALMFFLTLFFGLIPIKVRNFFVNNQRLSEREAKIGLSSCLCFGAGVLFATVFLHIFPESKEAFIHIIIQKKIRQTNYPIAELTFCSGFFLIYVIEEIAHWWARDSHFGHVHSESTFDGQESAVANRNSETNQNYYSEDASIAENAYLCQSEESIQNREVIENKTNSLRESSNKTKLFIFRSILVVSALSLHGCFEGLVIGLEGSVFGVWSFFLAICLHKLVIAFSIGMELLEVGIKTKLYFVHMIGFSLAAPLGAMIGLLLYNTLSENSDFGMVAIAILQAISGGTILFVVFCEVLERERAKDEGKIFRFLALATGFVVMACMQMLNETELSGDKGHSNITSSIDNNFYIFTRLYNVTP